jgi:hypothetical protein
MQTTGKNKLIKSENHVRTNYFFRFVCYKDKQPHMAEQKDNRILKVLLGIFILCLLGLGLWSYNTYNTYQENEGIKIALNDEKAQIQKELDNISSEYSLEIEKGNVLSADLTDARDRIKRLVDSVSQLKADIKVISILLRELSNIKKDRDLLQDRINTLEVVNQNLALENENTLAALNTEIIKSQDQNSTIANLNSNMARGSALIPTNLTPVGIIVRSTGKQIENDRASRVDDIKVCFTLPENPLATSGVASFYLQVINPDNNVLGENKSKEFDGQKLAYSKVVQFNYKGKELDLCEVVGVNEDNIVKGRYRINLYNGPVLVSSSEMTLR